MAERKKFYIAKIDTTEEEVVTTVQETKQENKFVSEQFVSSVSGYRVKNTNDVPYVRYGNKGYQYEGLKDKEERSEEYNRHMSASSSNRDDNRVPSYLQRPSYLRGENNMVNYPDNEREFIPGSPKIPNIYEEDNDYEEEPIEEELITYNSNSYESDYSYDSNDDVSLDSSSDVNLDSNDEASYDSNDDINIDSNDDVETNYEYSTTETYGSSDDYFERVKRFNPNAFKINNDDEKPSVEEVKFSDYTHIPENRPVYSTPDFGLDSTIDEFKDIELEFLGSSKKEEMTPIKKDYRQAPTVHEVKDSRVMPKAYKINYIPPKRSYLQVSKESARRDTSGVERQKAIIDNTLKEFNIDGSVVNYDMGPTITRFEIKLGSGVKVDRITGIKNNLKMNLSARAFRLEAPIRGKNTIGIEVDNEKSEIIYFGDVLTDEFLNDGKPVNVILGKDVSGNTQYLDIAKMPHGLICGTSGSGKSVCINNIIMSIIYKSSPEDVRLILVDPKTIEFALYKDIPHLITPIITDCKSAILALKWICEEMKNRYKLFEGIGRNLQEYNEYVKDQPNMQKLPYIVLIIDEFNDLMVEDKANVEECIKKLAAMARAAGIHLIIGTQRPTTDVVSGTIKANINTRLAFKVKTNLDSRTILDRAGAEELLGNGDMIYSDGTNETRLQGPFISSKEIVNACNEIRSRHPVKYMFSKEDLMKQAESEDLGQEDVAQDDYFKEIARWVVRNNSASINRISKVFQIGFNRAQAIMNELENQGIVSESLGTKPRTVLVTQTELEEILETI